MPPSTAARMAAATPSTTFAPRRRTRHRQSRGLLVVFAAVTQLASRCVNGDIWLFSYRRGAATPGFGVRGLVRAFGRRLCRRQTPGKASDVLPVPLDAVLLWRQVAKAAKAVTSPRTPNPCRSGARIPHCCYSRLSWVSVRYAVSSNVLLTSSPVSSLRTVTATLCLPGES